MTPVNRPNIVYIHSHDTGRYIQPYGHAVPFLEILVNSLAKKGVKDFVMLTGYRAEMIEDHFLAKSINGLTLRISHEEFPLGTGGAVKHAADFASDPSLLVNGDTFFDADINKLWQFHQEKRGK